MPRKLIPLGLLSEQLILNHIARQIKACRKKAKVGQQDLADYLSLSRVSVTNYERGTTVIPLLTLFRVADFFSVEVTSFLPTMASVKPRFIPDTVPDDFRAALLERMGALK